MMTLRKYGVHLKILHKDRQAQFSDLLMMDMPTWVTIPLKVNAADVDIFQRTLNEMLRDEILQAKFSDGEHDIWKQVTLLNKILTTLSKNTDLCY